jgi:hypothetical protein
METQRRSFRVEADPSGIVRVDIDARVIDRVGATAICAGIDRESARVSGRPLLLMNLGQMSRSTPAAGMYAWRQVRRIQPVAIAFHGGSALMRGIARSVLRLAGFEAYALFDDEESALAWLRARKDGV